MFYAVSHLNQRAGQRFGRQESRIYRHRCSDMLAYMVRTTVKLPEELDARLRHEAKRRGITIAELTREAIEAHIGSTRRLGAAAAGRSGRSDVSERIKEILATEVGSSL